MMKGIITKEFWEKYWTLLVEGKENHIAPVLFCALWQVGGEDGK